MVNLGERNEQIVGEKFALMEGADTWRLKTLVSLNLSRQKFRNATPSGPTLSYGTGDHGLDATIVGSAPDIAKMIAYSTRSASGDVPEKTWKLIATPLTGSNVTLTFKARLSDLDISHEAEGKVLFALHLDITDDTIAVS